MTDPNLPPQPAYDPNAAQQPAYSAPPAYAAPVPGQTGSTNTLAIVALILGILVPIGGIICGHIALRQIRRTGEPGHGLALAGTIIGYVLTVLGVLLVVGYIIAIVAIVGAAGAAGGLSPSDFAT